MVTSHAGLRFLTSIREDLGLLIVQITNVFTFPGLVMIPVIVVVTVIFVLVVVAVICDSARLKSLYELISFDLNQRQFFAWDRILRGGMADRICC